MKKQWQLSLEIWADSFHEGEWCCEHLAEVAKSHGYVVQKESYVHNFQPRFTFQKDEQTIELLVYGGYSNWNPQPASIRRLNSYAKPDVVAYDPSSGKILFSVEETAATPTGNQSPQRGERQYGAAQEKIPYWYFIR